MCNPATLPDDASVLAQVQVSDNCSVLSTNVTHKDGGNTCSSNRTFCIVATDSCQNSSTNKVTYYWSADITALTITFNPGTTNLMCNPATLPDDASVLAQVQVSDNCSVLSTNVTHKDGGNTCSSNRTFCIVATDSCQNSSTNKVTYYWSADMTRPEDP